MRVTVLGSGTSSGVPIPGCYCSVCTSPDPRNNRLRTSVLLEIQGSDVGRAPQGSENEEIVAHLLIDTSTDLRAQALRAKIKSIDAVLYTHIHADHIYGIDDLRSFNFINRKTIPVYASNESAQQIEQLFRYAFHADPDYRTSAPQLTLHRLEPYVPLQLFGVEILPLPVMHGMMEVYGFRVGNFCYITDCSFIPDRTKACMKNLKVLILDGLRSRPHPTHFTHAQAVNEIEQLKPELAYLTHISHEIDHEATNRELKQMTKRSVELAYDGLTLQVEATPS